MYITTPAFRNKQSSLGKMSVAANVLPLSWEANEGLFMTPLAKAEELVYNLLRLQEKLLHAVLQLFIAALKIRIHCPQMHYGRRVEEITNGQPFHKELEFIWKKKVKIQCFSYKKGTFLFPQNTFHVTIK